MSATTHACGCDALANPPTFCGNPAHYPSAAADAVCAHEAARGPARKPFDVPLTVRPDMREIVYGGEGPIATRPTMPRTATAAEVLAESLRRGEEADHAVRWTLCQVLDHIGGDGATAWQRGEGVSALFASIADMVRDREEHASAPHRERAERAEAAVIRCGAKGLLSEGQITKALDVDRITVRERADASQDQMEEAEIAAMHVTAFYADADERWCAEAKMPQDAETARMVKRWAQGRIREIEAKVDE